MRIVFVTCPDSAGAQLLRTLVTERLVAGGNIVPGVRSIYWWKGEICEESEEILWMETSEDRVPALQARIGEVHPYDTPKVLTFEPREATPRYLEWVQAETRSR